MSNLSTATREKITVVKVDNDTHFKLKEMALYKRTTIKKLLSTMIRENIEKLKQA